MLLVFVPNSSFGVVEDDVAVISKVSITDVSVAGTVEVLTASIVVVVDSGSVVVVGASVVVVLVGGGKVVVVNSSLLSITETFVWTEKTLS